VLGGKSEYWGNNYGYDAWGNLLAKTVTKCSAENISLTALPNNRLSGYGYDAAGNMTSDTTDQVTAVYDPENRIATATKSGITTSYSYDADGNRVEKSNGSTGTLYWYLTPGIVAESDLNGNLQSEYVFFDGERMARKDFPGNAVSYYFSDHLKTTNIVTDAQGNIKNESDFYPWGGELPFVANDSNHYKFTGKERDSETQLDYFGARYYSNGLGRWISADWSATPVPVPYADFGDPQSLNLYSYVRNVPTSRADADGHCDPTGQYNCSVLDHIAGAVGGLLNIVPETSNFATGMVNAVSGHFGGPQLEYAPLIQPDEHASAAGISLGTAGQVAIPAAQAAAEARAAGIVVGEVRTATAGAAAEGEGAGARAGGVPESIPAGPSAKPTAAQQRAINEMGEAHGCHTCGATSPGTKSGNWVGDHQPPTAQNAPGNPQVYKPQCLACSRQQGGEVRAAQEKAAAAAKKTEQPQ
jgi:RHS repeat-associated protein